MKRCIFLLFIITIILLSFNHGIAQMTSFIGGLWQQTPFPFLPIFSEYPFAPPSSYPPMPFLNPSFLPLPLIMPPLRPSSPLLLLPQISPPRPIVRNAATTITIFFNPTLSIIQVTVLPIGTAAPVPVVPTVAAAPTVAPTALALLPALLAATAAGPPYSYNPTASPTVKRLTSTSVLPGLTALLPLI